MSADRAPDVALNVIDASPSHAHDAGLISDRLARRVPHAGRIPNRFAIRAPHVGRTLDRLARLAPHVGQRMAA